MDEKQILVESMTSTGEGVGTLNGLKVFIEGALPQERVEATITTRKKNYALAALTRVITPSLHREKPACPLFGECGGCQLMHLSYAEQLEEKRKRVQESLLRIGHLDLEVAKTIPSPLSLGYRNKIQLPISHNQIGMYKKRSHALIPLERCQIHAEIGEEVLQAIKPLLHNQPQLRTLLLKSGIHTKECLVILVTDGTLHKETHTLASQIIEASPTIVGVVENICQREDNRILGERFTTLAGRPYLFEKILDKTFKISASSFFQVNTLQIEVLYRYLFEKLALTPSDTVIDAYTGVGTFALFAAPYVKKVVGFEVVAQAISDAKENAKLNNVENAHFKVGAAEKHLQPCDLLFLNPPRKGCDPTMIKKILTFLPHSIVYMSCDPASLARDLHALSSHYRVTLVQPFDMFPQTAHVETIVIMESLH